MKKTILLLLLIPVIGLSQSIKKNQYSDEFNIELQKIKKKAFLSTIDEKVRLRNYIDLICSKDISFDIKKLAYDELNKTESYFEGFLIDKKFDTKNIKFLYKIYENGLDEIAFAKEFKGFSDSINKAQILSEYKLKQLEDELKTAK